MDHSFKLKARVTLLSIIVLMLGACGKGGEGKGATQVAAKVDNSEISMHQVNQALRNAPNVTAENAAVMRKQILDRLIDQQIILEQANKDNLDRTPDVMMAIEAAKKDIIARAYIQKMVANTVKIDNDEIQKYYQEHPELFEARRIFTLQDIGLEKNDAIAKEISALLADGKSIEEIAGELKARDIKFSATTYARPAEQIPLDILPKLQTMSDGSIGAIDLANAIHVIKVVKTQSAPIDFKTATPVIKNYITNTRGKQVVDSEIKKLRSQSKIEYVGDFAKSGADSAVTTTTAPVVKEPVAPNENAIEKGVAGLK